MLRSPAAARKTLMSNITHAHPALADALAKKGYEKLTQVQDAVLDPKLLAKDLLVSAQTGSGKTVAFGLAMASTLLETERFLPADAPVALAIAPTRELALQVKRELDWLYREAGAKTASCVGGMDMRDERRALARGMSELKAIVLDEADEMLKMGFRDELEDILGAAPEERRTLMFSATVPKSILGMTKKYQRDAVRVNTAAEAKQHLDIEYRVMTVANSDKENAIINVLRFYNAKNAINALIIAVSLWLPSRVSCLKKNVAAPFKPCAMAAHKSVSRRMLLRAGLICLTLSLSFMQMFRRTAKLCFTALAERAARAAKVSRP